MLKRLILALVVTQAACFELGQILTTFEGNDELLSELSDNFANRFIKEYEKYQRTKIESPQLRQLSKELASLHSGGANLLITQVAELSLADQFVVCTTCRATVNVFARMFRDPAGELNGPNKEEVSRALVIDICRRINFQSDDVCGGMFDFNWPIIDFIMQNAIIDSRSMCGTLPISFCSVKQKEFEWSLNIDKNGPSEDVPKSEPPQKSGDDLVLLHLTDIHYDPLYKPGALANCDEALCCQRENTVGASKAAGYWSDYGACDSPWHMITDALQHIKKTHTKIDMIYNTGDIVDHMTWGTSKEKNKESLTRVNNLLAEVFPGIPVYSSVGNHEPHPFNVFGPPDVPEHISVQWMYEHLFGLWRKWLPEDTKSTILSGGFYTVAPKPGFRIISLNNNDCYLYNWWIYYNGSSVLPQLEWLQNTLLAAEKANEHVHILTHIPTGDSDCWTIWAREFNRICERFRFTISGIFNGHTHVDELNVHYNAKAQPFAVSWNGGSLTSYSAKNPNYKLLDLSSKTMEVVDFQTWIFNLTEANERGKDHSPNWFKEYEFVKEFTKDLSPAGMNKLLEDMADDPKLLRKFWRYKHTMAEPRIAKGCNDKCMHKAICRLATTVYDQMSRCKELQARLKIGLENEQPENPGGENPGGEDDGAAALFSTHKLFLISAVCLLAYLLN